MEAIGEDDDLDELKVGIKVNSDKEAYDLYNNYALKKGFSVRKGHLRKDPQNNVRQREFMCSKEGFHRDIDLSQPRKHNRLETRCGCKAMALFNVKDGLWTLHQINRHHNHDLAHPSEKQFLRSGRNINTAHEDVLNSLADAGVRPTQSYFYLANEMGGAGNVGFTRTDAHNYLQRKNDESMQAGDGQSLLNHFKSKQREDPNFFYSMQVDQKNRMTNIYWRDGKSKLDYECFGDVICFDTTFKTNKYNLICAPIVGVNHHWKNVLFGCAFLLDESTDTFVWLFESFLESMGYKHPKIIFTDEDKAMANAAERVLPHTCHRLCTWHIAKNAGINLASLYANPEFKKHFNKCLHGSYSEDQFQALWDEMIVKFDLQDHPWLKKLYSLKEKWCPAFTLDVFSARILSTQRSESTNNVFKHFSTHTMELVKFVHHYEKKAEQMRLKELEDDYRCKNGVPRLQVRSGMLKDAIDVYTTKMYYLFEKEFLGCMGVRVTEIRRSDGVYWYEAVEESHRTQHKIEYNYMIRTINCSCKMFQSFGILCRHALKVFDLNNITSLPTQYILKRWTKEAKQGIVVSHDQFEGSNMDLKSSRVLRLSELMHKGNKVYDLASLSASGTKIVTDMLDNALKRLEKEMEAMNLVELLKTGEEESNSGATYSCDLNSDAPNNDVLCEEQSVLDPPTIKAKGSTNGRMQYQLEKSNKKKRRTKGGQEKEHYKALSRTRALPQISTCSTSVPPQVSNQSPTPHSTTYPSVPPYVPTYIPSPGPFVPSPYPPFYPYGGSRAPIYHQDNFGLPYRLSDFHLNNG